MNVLVPVRVVEHPVPYPLATTVREPLLFSVTVALWYTKVTAEHPAYGIAGHVSVPVQLATLPDPVAATDPEPSGHAIVTVAVWPDTLTPSAAVYEYGAMPDSDAVLDPIHVPEKAAFKSEPPPVPPPSPPSPPHADRAATATNARISLFTWPPNARLGAGLEFEEAGVSLLGPAPATDPAATCS
jgi:hypothetical protein